MSRPGQRALDKRTRGKMWRFILFILLCTSWGSEGAAYCNSGDSSVLLEFKAGFPDKARVFNSWNASKDCCHWSGINCSSTGRVKGLTVQGGNLTGPIPSVLGNLSYLTNLDLSDNLWTGTLAEWLCNLTTLDALDLSQNKLDGVVPVSLLMLPNLRSLNLSWNSLRSELPSVSFISTVEQLFLQQNYLYGSISISFLSSLSNLRFLNLGNNNLSGSIPSSIGDLMGYLIVLDLSKNQLSGVIPTSISRLAYLNLSQNKLSGTIPSFGNTSFIKPIPDLYLPPSLDLSHNSLTGNVPPNLFNASGMVQLKLGTNQLSGEIPDFFGSCDLLQSLCLNNNKFQGNLPASLQNCSKLTVLDLRWNELNGNLPSWLKNFAPLRVFMIGSNNFHGSLHMWLAKNASLQVLDFSNNKFSGPIPPNLNQLKGLLQPGQFLSRGTLYDDEIQLTVKDQVLDFKYLLSATTSLDLSGNEFDGNIPEQLGDLLGLLFLNLARNNLSGMIPLALANMTALESLDLSTNQLNGPIPLPVSVKLTSLAYLNVSSNFLSGEIPYKNPPFTTFLSSSFMDNPGLCGPPLQIPCSSLQREPPSSAPSAIQESFIQKWLSIPAFGVGISISFTLLSSFLLPLAYESGKRCAIEKPQPRQQEFYGVFKPLN